MSERICGDGDAASEREVYDTCLPRRKRAESAGLLEPPTGTETPELIHRSVSTISERERANVGKIRVTSETCTRYLINHLLHRWKLG